MNLAFYCSHYVRTLTSTDPSLPSFCWALVEDLDSFFSASQVTVISLGWVWLYFYSDCIMNESSLNLDPFEVHFFHLIFSQNQNGIALSCFVKMDFLCLHFLYFTAWIQFFYEFKPTLHWCVFALIQVRCFIWFHLGIFGKDD